jgi:hypothetical protein
MKLNSAVTLLLVVALLTPMAAILGLYDATVDEFARFAAPAIGAAAALYVVRLLGRRR